MMIIMMMTPKFIPVMNTLNNNTEKHDKSVKSIRDPIQEPAAGTKGLVVELNGDRGLLPSTQI